MRSRSEWPKCLRGGETRVSPPLSWATVGRRLTIAARPFLVALFLGVVVWWIAIPPSHDRPWRPEVAVMPRAFIDGDRVRLTGVRDFDYRSRDDFTVHHKER